MSGASSSNNTSTTKATTNDSKSTPSTASEGAAKKTPLLEEDDEFEDFPVDDWPDNETVAAENANASPEGSAHLWEESWDDDDTNEDFAVMLKQELSKMGGDKK